MVMHETMPLNLGEGHTHIHTHTRTNAQECMHRVDESLIRYTTTISTFSPINLLILFTQIVEIKLAT